MDEHRSEVGRAQLPNINRNQSQGLEICCRSLPFAFLSPDNSFLFYTQLPPVGENYWETASCNLNKADGTCRWSSLLGKREHWRSESMKLQRHGRIRAWYNKCSNKGVPCGFWAEQNLHSMVRYLCGDVQLVLILLRVPFVALTSRQRAMVTFALEIPNKALNNNHSTASSAWKKKNNRFPACWSHDHGFLWIFYEWSHCLKSKRWADGVWWTRGACFSIWGQTHSRTWVICT